MFVPDKPLKYNLMFVTIQVEHLSGAPLYGMLLVLPTNIRNIKERLNMDKHSSLLQKLENYGHLKFYNIGP